MSLLFVPGFSIDGVASKTPTLILLNRVRRKMIDGRAKFLFFRRNFLQRFRVSVLAERKKLATIWSALEFVFEAF